MSHVHGLGSHTHAGTAAFPSVAPTAVNPTGTGAAQRDHGHTFTTGGPSPGSTDGADMETSAQASTLPPYLDVLFCRKVPGPKASPRPTREAGDGRSVPRAIGDATTRLVYTPVAPCRIADTRRAGGSLQPGVPRELRVTGASLGSQGGSDAGCGVPFGRATAALVNFVAVNPAGPGNLRAWAYRTPPPAAPNSSILNYAFIPGSGLNLANGIAIPICDATEAGQPCPQDIRVQADGSGLHLVADVLGFFERVPTEELADQAVPSGAIVVWDQSSECPVGYSRAAAFDGRFPRGAAVPGQTGGADTHAHERPHNHGLGNHTHAGTTGPPSSTGGGGQSPMGTASALHTHTFTTGGPSVGGTEDPSTTTTGPAPNAPPYAEVLFCRKDSEG